ncbi:conserved protein of unknown function [Ectopseudomonas oleovorans]|uniref:Uncharacterized protein n=1 Tax=Ectopseudomonas oleovorans TaxID=301 RepID=A0A653B936_ECTOL|nr:conserved protein of unknown function [Pseudomonas oleovorans]
MVRAGRGVAFRPGIHSLQANAVMRMLLAVLVRAEDERRDALPEDAQVAITCALQGNSGRSELIP